MVEHSAPFKRIYFDIPSELHAIMQAKAKAAGMTNKDYLARLIERDTKGGKAGKK